MMCDEILKSGGGEVVRPAPRKVANRSVVDGLRCRVGRVDRHQESRVDDGVRRNDRRRSDRERWRTFAICGRLWREGPSRSSKPQRASRQFRTCGRFWQKRPDRPTRERSPPRRFTLRRRLRSARRTGSGSRLPGGRRGGAERCRPHRKDRGRREKPWDHRPAEGNHRDFHEPARLSEVP